MKTGRPRKPTALKVLEGETRPSRIPKNEPKPRPKRPETPQLTTKTAQELWDEYAPKLESIGTLTEVDQSHLTAFCEAYAEALWLEKFVAENGYTIETPSGYIQQRPEVSIRNKAWDRVAKFGSELGIGAASRSRIEVKKPDAEDNPLQAIVEANRARRAQRKD